MGNQIYEQNMSDKKLIVDSIEVLSNISGNGVTKITKEIEAMKQQLNFPLKQHDYWADLVSDGIITPVEKKQLKREITNITNSYNAIMAQAIDQGLEGSDYILDYQAAYNTLYEHLYTTLHLFDEMEENTEIVDIDLFNLYFNQYSYSEKFTQIALNIGVVGGLNYRVLESLTEPGTEGEIGFYRGTIYQYVDGYWNAVGTENYAGTLNSLPPNAYENIYFMVSEDFNVVMPLWVNGLELWVNETDPVDVPQHFEQGFIYVYQQEFWHKITDPTDHRYIMATLDYVAVTGELPEWLYDALQESIEQQISTMHIPGYLGPQSSDPMSPQEGDYYCYSGTTTTTRENSDIYMYHNDEWVHVDPTDTSKSKYYMQALDDILNMNNVDDGHFAALFCATFFAHQATMDNLQTKSIELQGNGAIYSENYSSTAGTGFYLDGDTGDMWVNQIIFGDNITFAGAKVTGKVSAASLADDAKDSQKCGGKTIISGDYIQTSLINVSELKAATGMFTNIKVTGEADFTAFKCSKETKTVSTKSFGASDNGLMMAGYTDKFLGVSGFGNGATVLSSAFPTGKKITCHGTKVAKVSWREWTDTSVTPNRFYGSVAYYNSSGTLIDNAIGYISTYGGGLIISKALTGNVTYTYKIDNQNVVRMIGLPTENVGIDGAVINEHGLLQQQNNNYIIKRHYPAGYSEHLILNELMNYIKTGTAVSCIGNYGGSSSSSNNAIAFIEYDVTSGLKFKNVNETTKLDLSSDSVLAAPLNICFMSNIND